MNSTEQKIREAYAAAVQKDIYVVNYHSFKTGYMALLNSSEPSCTVVDSDSLESIISPALAVGTALYEHPPTPSAVEGLLDLLAIIHRDGGHYTDEHGILKSVTDAKDKVWTMLAAARGEK